MIVLTAGYLLLVALIAGRCFPKSVISISSSVLENKGKEGTDDPWRYDSSSGPLRQWENLLLLSGTTAMRLARRQHRSSSLKP